MQSGSISTQRAILPDSARNGLKVRPGPQYAVRLRVIRDKAVQLMIHRGVRGLSEICIRWYMNVRRAQHPGCAVHERFVA